MLKGGGGADKLFGGAGNDMLNSDGIGEFLDGGTGNDDSVDFADAQNSVYVDLGMGRYNQGHSYKPSAPGTPDNIVGVENVYGSKTHDTSSATVPITTSPAKAASTPSSAATATTPSMAAPKTTGSTAKPATNF